MIGEWNGLLPVVSEDPGGCRILAEERKQRMRSRTPVWGLPKALRCQISMWDSWECVRGSTRALTGSGGSSEAICQNWTDVTVCSLGILYRRLA
ncbi:unnamed protein product [Prunus armeniaca]